MYSLRYSVILTYMLQSTEYRAWPYLKWFWRTEDFSKVAVRRKLVKTKASRLLQLALLMGMIIQILVGLLVLYLWHWHNLTNGLVFGVAIIISYPIVWAHLVVVPLWFGRIFIVQPREDHLIAVSEHIFRRHKAPKIAIAGSYAKTSMKEILFTVLSEGKKVAATPANKNVAVSHAIFAHTLSKDIDIIILEYGEGRPGDVMRFANITHPTFGIITGLAPAHLDRYKTITKAGEDIFSLAKYLDNKNTYVNGESPLAEPFFKPEFTIYNQYGLADWTVSNVRLTINGTSFYLNHNNRSLHLHSKLLGRHNIGPLALAAVLADRFGLNTKQIISGIAKTMAFEHRMQPYKLSEAWIIDDTYNGNIEGIRAGTDLLAELPAKRKIYVTPGLVDQGKEKRSVHEQAGELIAKSGSDVVVLMKNSTTHYIQSGLMAAGFQGQLRIENDPLKFYSNLSEFVAAGDIVMLQNDWTDNYA
jgi:UDP-N-acetylmuramoyl-tripeptide--D-alanyl-D-alanine ligase